MQPDIQPLSFPLAWVSQQAGNHTFTIPNHPSIEAEEINLDHIAHFGDMDKEHTGNS